MNYLTLFEGKTLFNKLWLLFHKRAKLDLRLANSFSKIDKIISDFVDPPFLGGEKC